jgi:hypothetical protein
VTLVSKSSWPPARRSKTSARAALGLAAGRRAARLARYVDCGISGSKGCDKRPAFKKLTKDAAGGKLDMVAAQTPPLSNRSSIYLFSAKRGATNSLWLRGGNLNAILVLHGTILALAAEQMAGRRSLIPHANLKLSLFGQRLSN